MDLAEVDDEEGEEEEDNFEDDAEIDIEGRADIVFLINLEI